MRELQLEAEVLWPYRGTARRLVVQAKECPEGPAAWWLHASLRDWIRRADPPWPPAVWVTPPPSWRRRRQQWFLPEFLARRVAPRCGHRHARLLKRRAGLRDQADLGGLERRWNLHGAFRAGRALARRPPRRVVLLDDVATTGSSLRECRRVLQQTGVQEVRCLVLAGAFGLVDGC